MKFGANEVDENNVDGIELYDNYIILTTKAGNTLIEYNITKDSNLDRFEQIVDIYGFKMKPKPVSKELVSILKMIATTHSPQGMIYTDSKGVVKHTKLRRGR